MASAEKRHNLASIDADRKRSRQLSRRFAFLWAASPLAIFSVGFVLIPHQALAICGPPATPGNDTITCNFLGGDNSPFNALGGEDTINIDSGVFASDISGGADNDFITKTDGTISNFSGIHGDGGHDTILHNGGTTFRIRGGAGNDIITHTGGFVGDLIPDITPLFEGIHGDEGEDTITLNGAGAVTTFINGGADNDTINLLAGTIPDNGAGDQITVRGGEASDIITLDGASVYGISGGGAQLAGDTGDTINLLSGQAEFVYGDPGDDVITLDGATIGVAFNNFFIHGDNFSNSPTAGNDTINLLSGTLNGFVFGGGLNDIITLDGATVTISINGESGNDTINLVSGAVPVVTGGTNEDVINVFSGFDLTQMTLIDGDDGFQSGTTDTLNLIGQSVEAGNLPSIVNMDIINLTQSTNLFVTTGSESITAGLLTTDLSSVIDMQDGAVDDQLTINGDYSGTGTLALDIDESTGVADLLAISGSVTGGATGVTANNVGASTASGPIDVVQVTGATGIGDFVLAQPVQNTIYNYNLVLNVNTWRLEQDGIMDDTPLDPVLPNVVIGDVRQFVGMFWDRETATRGRPQISESNGDKSGINARHGTNASLSTWARAEGLQSDGRGDISGAPVPLRSNYDKELKYLQGGFNSLVTDTGSGRTVASIFGHFGSSDTDVNSPGLGGVGSLDVESYGVAGSITWLGAAAEYLDFVALYSWHDIDRMTMSGATGKTNGQTLALSAEGGKRFDLSSSSSVIPQAQIVYQSSRIDRFVDSVGIVVDADDAESLEGRAGLRFHFENQVNDVDNVFRFHVRADIVHEFLEDAITTVNGVGLGYDQTGTGYELGSGIQIVPVSGYGFKLGAQVDYRAPFDRDKGQEYLALSGIAGFNW